jgi:hypothetical protein
MIRLLLIIAIITSTYTFHLFSQTSNLKDIQFDIAVFSERTAKIGYYYGKKILLKDSVQLDKNGRGSISGQFHEGLYVLYIPDSVIYDFFLTAGLHYKIFQDQFDGIALTISGSKDAESYAHYQKEMIRIKSKSDSIGNILSVTKAATLNNFLRIQQQKLRHESDSIRNQYAVKLEGSLPGNYIKSQLPVSLNSIENIEGNKKVDSLQWMTELALFREHYFENVVWDDPRLIYTPVLEDKTDNYLDRVTSQTPGSLSTAIDAILSFQINEAVKNFILQSLLVKYQKEENSGLGEYLYLYVIEHYFLSGGVPGLSDKDLFKLQSEYQKRRPVSLLMHAPEIALPDKNGNTYSLCTIKAELTLIFFWDYECPACLRILSDLVKVYEKYSPVHMLVYTIYLGKDEDIWRAFLAKIVPTAWINTINTGPVSYPDLYNVSKIPTMFLLDRDKKILDKNFTVTELDSYLFKFSRSASENR